MIDGFKCNYRVALVSAAFIALVCLGAAVYADVHDAIKWALGVAYPLLLLPLINKPSVRRRFKDD